MVKEWNFLHAVDLSFDAKFGNIISLVYTIVKQCPINDMKLHC